MTETTARRTPGRVPARWVIGLSVVALMVAWGSVFRPASSPPSVLGEKIRSSCTLAATPASGATPSSVTLPAGVYHEQATNAPLTFSVRGGALGSVLTPPLQVPGPAAPGPQVVAFHIGIRAASAGRFTVTATFVNRSDCPVVLSVARALAEEPGGLSFPSAISFGSSPTAVLTPGAEATGTGILSLSRDGDYSLGAQVYAELGGVR